MTNKKWVVAYGTEELTLARWKSTLGTFPCTQSHQSVLDQAKEKGRKRRKDSDARHYEDYARNDSSKRMLGTQEINYKAEGD
jgi:hypothetical protein